MIGNILTFILGIKMIDVILYKQYDPYILNKIDKYIPTFPYNKYDFFSFIDKTKNKTFNLLRRNPHDIQPYIFNNNNDDAVEPFSEFNILFLIL